MRNIALRYGAIMFVGFTLFFLVMHAFSLSDKYYFRIFNAVIHVAVIAVAMRKYKNLYPDEFNYLSGVGVGMFTSAVGVIPFAIFQLIFLATHPDFVETLRQNVETVGQYLTPFTASLIVLVEGLAASIIISYIVMRIVEAMGRDKPYMEGK